MFRYGAHLMAVSWLGVVWTASAGAEPAVQSPRCYDVAKPLARPVGAPKASDVIMRSLRIRPANKKDPHDTMQALRDFHVTRLEWAYIDNKAFIAKVKASGRVFGGAASAPSYRPRNGDREWFEKVVVVNAKGEPIIAPWKRTWKRTLWGCVNNPELERGYLEYLKRYIDAGAQVMQRDEPGANSLATRWGGCFCPHCMKAFREYLKTHTTPEKRRELGVTDVDTFDYGKHLRECGAPVGDAFGRWKGGELKQLFVQFQTDATIAFHKRTRSAIDAYAGRHVPVSCNNGVQRWTPIQLEFDWAFGELSYGHAKPEFLYNAMRTARQHDRIQVVTMPKKGDTKDIPAWVRRTRQTIATAYATGGLCMVPWDVFMPKDAPRYFGKPEQYADLFGFIRANSKYLDGYEDAAVASKGLTETRYGAAAPVTLTGGTGQVRAFVRTRPGDANAPIVIHLVEWGSESKPFTIQLRRACLFGDRPVALTLVVPTAYDAAAHTRAEKTGDYASAQRALELRGTTNDPFITAHVPALTPWGLLIVSPAQR